MSRYSRSLNAEASGRWWLWFWSGETVLTAQCKRVRTLDSMCSASLWKRMTWG